MWHLIYYTRNSMYTFAFLMNDHLQIETAGHSFMLSINLTGSHLFTYVSLKWWGSMLSAASINLRSSLSDVLHFFVWNTNSSETQFSINKIHFES